MIAKIKKFFRDQPFLAGCAGMLAMAVFMVCGVVGLAAVGMGSCVSACNAQTGLDSLFDTIGDANEAGFGLSVNISSESAIYSFDPKTRRTVTCGDLEALLFPHLTGTRETITLVSRSFSEGDLEGVLIECTYSGYPGSEGAPAP